MCKGIAEEKYKLLYSIEWNKKYIHVSKIKRFSYRSNSWDEYFTDVLAQWKFKYHVEKG